MKYEMIKLFILYVLCSLLIAPGAMAQSNGNSNQPLCQNSLIESYELSSGADLASSSSQLDALTNSFVKTPAAPLPPGSKSPIIAAALSFVIPGAGEYYVGDYIWRGMIFTGIEAGLWIEWIHWN